ncbi:MAG: hypothetical protein FWC53_02250 [Firmicutes bacterium]|nr:hypothetical protein [Bacillota bacterium]
MKINKKLVIFIVAFFLIIFLVCLFFIIMRSIEISNNNKKPVFKISQILLYSSADITDSSPKRAFAGCRY